MTIHKIPPEEAFPTHPAVRQSRIRYASMPGVHAPEATPQPSFTPRSESPAGPAPFSENARWQRLAGNAGKLAQPSFTPAPQPTFTPAATPQPSFTPASAPSAQPAGASDWSARAQRFQDSQAAEWRALGRTTGPASQPATPQPIGTSQPFDLFADEDAAPRPQPSFTPRPKL